MDQQTIRHELWRRGELSWLLWEQQRYIYERIRNMPPNIRTIVLQIARQFGKSVLGCILALEDCLGTPEVLVTTIGPTIVDTRDIVLPRVRMLLKSAPKGLVRLVKSEDTYYFANGSEWKLSGFDTDVSPRGKTIHRAYVEELCRSNPDKYRDFMRSELGPALAHSTDAVVTCLTTPPSIPDHPFLTETVVKAKEQNALFVYTIDDNIALPPGRRDELIEEAGGIDSVECQREYYCRVVRDPTVMLTPEFNEAKHVQKFTIPNFKYFWVAGDVGGTNDKSSILLLFYHWELKKLCVAAEAELPNTSTDEEIALAGKDLEREYTTSNDKVLRYIDCFGQSRINFSRQYGWFTSLPKCKQIADTMAGVKDVRARLRRNELLIHPRCEFLIKTLRSGQWNSTRKDFLRTEDLGHCDALAALVYGVRNAILDDPNPHLYNISHDTHAIPTTIEERRNDTAEAFQTIFTPK